MVKINVLSLFDGMSCGQIALKKLGIKINKYYASEIDKYAIQITQKNFPKTIQLGDIKNIKGNIFPKIDLLIGGSPCQGFSFAGKQLNFNDERSKLFFEFVRLLKECKPKYFLLENVRMKQEYQDIISKYVGIKPIEINSALVSAQQRKRLYWTNISNIKQPKDKKIYLKDIIESGSVDRDKSYCIDANYFKGGNLKQYFEKCRRQLIFEKPIRVAHLGKGGQGDRIYSTNGKSICLSALGGGRGAKTGIYAIAQRGRYIVNGKRKDIKGAKTTQRFETSFSKKSNTLTSVQKDSYLLKIKNQYYIVRKLTPIECERLQTISDDYTKGVSNTQRYKMLGNGWTIDVITHILKNMRY